MSQKERGLEQNLEEQKERLLKAISLNASPRVFEAIASVPREEFLPHYQHQLAYFNSVLPIPGYEGRSSVSQPMLVATMTEMLDPQPDERVLEIGTASGYQAAILAKLSHRVVSVEIFPDLARQARERLERLEIKNVDVVVADAGSAFANNESFDKILALHPCFHLLIYRFTPCSKTTA